MHMHAPCRESRFHHNRNYNDSAKVREAITFIIITIIITLFGQTQRNKNSELDSRAGQHGSIKAIGLH